MNLFSLRGAVRFRVRDLWRQALAALLILVCIPVLTATAADQKMFPQDSVLRATLENGLRVVIVRNDLAPVATTMINYLAGSNEDPKGSPGQAHALEHMMFRGSPDLTAGQLANIVAELGGKFNAMTQPTVTQYFLTVPAEDLDVALRIEAIRMKGLLSTEDLWREERGAIDQEVVRDLSSPEYLFYTKLLENMFKSTPYANSGLGTTASFARIAGAELKQFHEAWYVPNNAVLVIVGKVDPARTLETIKKYFGSIPCRKTPVRPAVQFKPVQPNTIRLTTGNPYGLYILAFRMPGYSNRDYPASEVLNDILNSTRGDLFNLVIDGKALMTGFELMTYPETGIGLVVAAFPDGRNPAPLIRDVKRILRKNIRRGFPSDLVDSAKRKRLTQAELEKNSVQGMAMSWSEAVAVQGRSSPDQTKLEIARVTSSEVNRVARKYLLFDHAIAAGPDRLLCGSDPAEARAEAVLRRPRRLRELEASRRGE